MITFICFLCVRILVIIVNVSKPDFIGIIGVFILFHSTWNQLNCNRYCGYSKHFFCSFFCLVFFDFFFLPFLLCVFDLLIFLFCFSFLGIFHLVISYDIEHKGRRYNLLDPAEGKHIFRWCERLFISSFILFLICHQKSLVKPWHSVSGIVPNTNNIRNIISKSFSVKKRKSQYFIAFYCEYGQI